MKRQRKKLIKEIKGHISEIDLKLEELWEILGESTDRRILVDLLKAHKIVDLPREHVKLTVIQGGKSEDDSGD